MMFTVIGIVFVTLAIIFIEYPLLKESKLKKEIYLFSILLFIGIGLNIITSLDIKYPNLLDWMIIVYKPISQIVDKWLS